MKTILMEAAKMEMSEQMEFIKKQFNTWKAAYEQVDDVCIIGIRL